MPRQKMAERRIQISLDLQTCREVERLAETEMRSLSAMCCILVRAGLRDVQARIERSPRECPPGRAHDESA
jgi:hypothetical protein